MEKWGEKGKLTPQRFLMCRLRGAGHIPRTWTRSETGYSGERAVGETNAKYMHVPACSVPNIYAVASRWAICRVCKEKPSTNWWNLHIHSTCLTAKICRGHHDKRKVCSKAKAGLNSHYSRGEISNSQCSSQSEAWGQACKKWCCGLISSSFQDWSNEITSSGAISRHRRHSC